jgi:hypothetical protein
VIWLGVGVFALIVLYLLAVVYGSLVTSKRADKDADRWSP